MFEKIQEQAGTLSALVQDAVSGIQTIKTFGREEGVIDKFTRKTGNIAAAGCSSAAATSRSECCRTWSASLTAGIVVLFGGMLTLDGTMTLGNFAQFLSFLGMISIVLLQLGTIYQRYQQTAGALYAHDAAAATRENPQPSPMPCRSKTPRGDISFEHVSVAGRWQMAAARHFARNSCRDGGRASSARRAAAKRVLVNLLARVFDPTEGRVLIDGHDVRSLDLKDLRHAIAYVPQSTFLFSDTLRENVRMSKPDLTDDDLDRAIHISRVSNDLPQLPHGLETMVGEKGVMLSGGQKQRVAIARAIVRDPAILVLDDALSSVDTHTAADILGDLRQVLRTRTSLIIAHRIATVKDADRIIVMAEGRIVEQGTHNELIAQRRHVRADGRARTKAGG